MEREESATLPATWTAKLFAATGVSPIWVGFGLAALMLASFFGIEYARGQIDAVLAGTAPPHIAAHFRSIAINSFIVAYLVTALVYQARWTRANLDELAPLLRNAGDATAEWLKRRESSAASRAGGVAGMTLIFVVFFLPTGTVWSFAKMDYWVLEHAWEDGMLLVLGWLAGRFLYESISDSLRFSSLASKLESIDLLDLEALQPFTRQGLRSALLSVLLVSLTLGHLGSAFIPAIGIGVVLIATLAAATSALSLPLRGVHQRIREAKRVKLAELRGAIRRGERDALAQTGNSDHVTGLLALEARIAGVREWPFDAPSVARFFLYVGLGLGSWVGGAAVERLLDHLLSG